MKEIKFRAKRIDNGRWVYGQYFKTPLTDENSGTTPDAGWFFLIGETRHCIVQDSVAFVIDERTLGQYTGKQTKGVDVYEDDIVSMVEVNNERTSEYITPIIWEDASFVMKSGESDYDTFLAAWCGGINTYPLFEMEVIGNIHDNPELLEVGSDVKNRMDR